MLLSYHFYSLDFINYLNINRLLINENPHFLILSEAVAPCYQQPRRFARGWLFRHLLGFLDYVGYVLLRKFINFWHLANYKVYHLYMSLKIQSLNRNNTLNCELLSIDRSLLWNCEEQTAFQKPVADEAFFSFSYPQFTATLP